METDQLVKVETYTATIYVGYKEGYSSRAHNVEKVREVCQNYCDAVGLCVTITETEYVYTNGGERGAMVGLINYPRFPSSPEEIRRQAITLASRLRIALKQHRVSIVFPDKTVMLGDA